MAKRFSILLFGVISYVIFLGAFLYAIGFVGNLVVPKAIDTGAADGTAIAWLVDVALLGLFAVQHSVMARPAFKAWWTRVIPEASERSMYVLLSSLALILLFWQWRPLPGTAWQVTSEPGHSALIATFWLGWGVVLLSTFLINHFHLFGLYQVYSQFRARPLPQAGFVTPFLYQLVRHPIMLGFLLAFWGTPNMTVSHLVFSLATTGYIFIGVAFEEHDLRKAFGARYEEYRQRVPMFIPFLPKPAAPRSARQVSGT